VPLLQAPKPQASKEAKALAATNSSKGKKKVRGLDRACAEASMLPWLASVAED
jgi:hypothetical protein